MNHPSRNLQSHISQYHAKALYRACKSVVEHRNCSCDNDFQNCSVCQCASAIQAIQATSDLDRADLQITPEQFMEFFRSDEFHQQMDDDDCRELFAYALKGSSDFTEEFLNEIFADYSVENLLVVNRDTLKQV